MNLQTIPFESVPSHFFKHGKYEVWGRRGYTSSLPLVKIADGLSLETAKAFRWHDKQIRLNGKWVD